MKQTKLFRVIINGNRQDSSLEHGTAKEYDGKGISKKYVFYHKRLVIVSEYIAIGH